MALPARPYGLCETKAALRGRGRRRRDAGCRMRWGLNRIVPGSRRHRCRRRAAGHALVVLGAARRDRQCPAALPAGTDAAPAASPVQISSLRHALTWRPGCTVAAQGPSAAPVMAEPRKETLPARCQPGAGVEGCLAPALVYFSSSAAASLLFHASKEAENAHSSGVSFDAKRVCERCRRPRGLAVPQRWWDCGVLQPNPANRGWPRWKASVPSPYGRGRSAFMGGEPVKLLGVPEMCLAVSY